MKRPLLFLLILTSLTACNNNAENKNVAASVKTDTVRKEISQKIDTTINFNLVGKTSSKDSSLKGEFKNYKIFNLADTIKADLNSDKILDFAYFTHNDNKEIFIIDGQTKIATKVGLEKSFGSMGSSFNWVDFWGTTNDNETFEVIIKDSEIVGERKIKLENISLFVREDEVGGGVITFKKGKYVWVHQSD
jgi:hypothetical protein